MFFVANTKKLDMSFSLCGLIRGQVPVWCRGLDRQVPVPLPEIHKLVGIGIAFLMNAHNVRSE
jgi:hypothetical protein